MDKLKQTKRLIADIVQKNYSNANTTLQKIVENKIKSKIKKSLDQKK